MLDFSNFNSIISIMNYFRSSKVCKQAIIESRWMNNGELDVVCPYCGQHDCHKRKDGRYVCRNCNHNFSETVGTIFENTKINKKTRKTIKQHNVKGGCKDNIPVILYFIISILAKQPFTSTLT